MSFFLHMQNVLLQHKIVIVEKKWNTLIFGESFWDTLVNYRITILTPKDAEG